MLRKWCGIGVDTHNLDSWEEPPVFMAAITGYHGLESSSDFVEIVLRLSVTKSRQMD